ncbi:MAG: hypothetical protein LIQ31_13250 [Planctomycetes bacterium]|nr:hypothetical protein [Planctomycetota bacterium]
MENMNGVLWILIDGRTSEVNSVLAKVALRQAATRKGIKAVIHVREPDGAGGAGLFSGVPSSGDRLLVVGTLEPPLPWAGLPVKVTSLEEALNDPHGMVTRATEETTSNTSTRKTLLSALGGWMKK